jgi:tetratricopeptide (TPR) repeat protein
MSPVEALFARADALVGEALAAVGDGRSADAVELLDVATAMFEAAGGPDHPDVAHCLVLAARLARGAGRFGAARRDAARAVDILDAAAHAADLDPELRIALARLEAQALGERAAVEIAEDRLDAAEVQLLAALRVAAPGGDRDPVLAPLHAQLGRVHEGQGRLDDAERHWRQALAILEAGQTTGAAALEIAHVQRNLAALRHRRGHTTEAEALLQRAVALAEGRLGADHPQVAVDVASLAAVVHDAGRSSEAEGLYRRSLAALRAALGDDHLEVGAIRSSLGGVLLAQGRLGEAAAELSTALASQETSLGAAHPAVALTAYRLAAVRLGEGHLADAAQLCGRAAAALGPEHPHAIAVRALAASIEAARDHAA